MAVSVLVVDDNPLNLKLARLVLIADGHDVAVAGDGEEALELLAAQHPDVLLVDVQMPGMDGLELTRRVKADAATRDIPVVALSAAVQEADRLRALEAGCCGCLAKPLDTRRLSRDLLAVAGIEEAP